MRFSLFVAFTVLVVFANVGCANPMQTIINKVRNLLSTFLTNAQIKQMVEKTFNMAWNNKTPQEIQKEMIPFALQIVNNKQKTMVMNTYSKMSNELGGAKKAEALLNVLINKLTGTLNPYIKQLEATIKKQRSKGKAAAQKQTLTNAGKMLVKKNIQTAINQVKKAFTQKQCNVAFKYLAGTYLKLGVYKFKATPCTGKGV